MEWQKQCWEHTVTQMIMCSTWCRNLEEFIGPKSKPVQGECKEKENTGHCVCDR